MRFRGVVNGTRVTINVDTNDVSDAVFIASGLGCRLTVVPAAERNPKITARELLDKGDLFRSEYLKTACRMLGNAIIDDNAARDMVDFDDAQYQREQKPAKVWVVLYRNGDTWETPAFTSKERATYWVRDQTNNLDGAFAWHNSHECLSMDGKITFTLNETTVQ